VTITWAVKRAMSAAGAHPLSFKVGKGQPVSTTRRMPQAPSREVAVRLARVAATARLPAEALASADGASVAVSPLSGLRAAAQPGSARARAAALLHLQRTAGNRAVQRSLQCMREIVEPEAEPKRGGRLGDAAFSPRLVHRVAITSRVMVVQRALIDDFAGKFADSAALIRKSPEAVKLVKEAETAGTKFGGYSEDGPGKDAWPYTIGDTVYVPKAHTDKVTAMSDFLFELNNAVRSPKFAEITKEAAKGSKGSLSAKDYAYKVVEQEVEGMLRLGQVWFETKKTMGSGKELDKYDAEMYLAEYNAYKDKKKTKDEIVKDVLKREYTEGDLKGKTVEQNYMEQYNRISGGK
jgi:hypothetical protein